MAGLEAVAMRYAVLFGSSLRLSSRVVPFESTGEAMTCVDRHFSYLQIARTAFEPLINPGNLFD